ncbi:chaperone Ric-8A-like [Apostichopus japonicus]|uniref:chaperone Ric-8A-like n=1 Tax=Stichopus japonicus TaxID=307972 RepID=UPI003AB78441
MDAQVTAMLPVLGGGNTTEICNKLQEFNKEHAQTFAFGPLQTKTKEEFVSSLLKVLGSQSNPECVHLSLEAVRILSREKTRMFQLEQPTGVNTLLRLAGLSNNGYEIKPEIITEAQKCLCNLIYLSTKVQRICGESNECTANLLARVKQYHNAAITEDMKFFDMRFLFLLTALCPNLRNRVRSEYNGVAILTDLLESSCFGLREAAAGGSTTLSEPDQLNEKQTDMACEILKAVFNTIIHATVGQIVGESDDVMRKQGQLLRRLLMAESISDDKTDELSSQTINVLTCHLPSQCIGELIPETLEGAAGGRAMYDGHNMDAIVRILNFVENRIDRTNRNSGKGVVELLSPSFSALSILSKSNRHIRKFLREMVLPPLKEASKLPEEGGDLRNKLVRLMTSTSTDVKESVADFLFILCKESVERLIKYTGYGNAAGMLARRGLLLGGRGSEDYSSDEDSDTEEYQQIRDQINPVTGRVEPERPDPMAGMSEEQKEIQAHELASMITRMSREGVIQPMAVGEDGNLIPLEERLAAAVLEETPPSSDPEN